MKIALVGPSDLTEYDRKEVMENIHDFISKGNEIVILAYRSIEIEVFKYFINHIDVPLKDEQGDVVTDEDGEPVFINHAPKLHIYTFQQLDSLPQKLRTPIEYLKENGAHHTSFEHEEMTVVRSVYANSWKEILKEVDIVVSFLDRENFNSIPKLNIPVDQAKKMGIKSVIYQLPRADEQLASLHPNEKIRVVENE